VVKQQVNAIALPSIEEFRRDYYLFIEGVKTQEFQDRIQAAMRNGFQTPEGELDLPKLLGDLA